MRPSPRLILATLICAALSVGLTLVLTDPGMAVFGPWAVRGGAVVADLLVSVAPRRVAAEVTLPHAGMVGVVLPFRIHLQRKAGRLPQPVTLRFDLDAGLGDGILPPVTAGSAEMTVTGHLTPNRRGVFHLRALSTVKDAFIFEDCVDDSPLRHELTHEKVQAVDGYITVPDRPGLGVTLDEDFVKSTLVCESR